jgi:hypothetical protein
MSEGDTGTKGELTTEALVARFRTCTLPKAAWTHFAHLRVGAWHVHHRGAAAALAALREGIRRLNDSHGTVNSPTSGYHETITVAYVRLIEAFFATFDDAVPFDDRLAALLAGPLADRSALLHYWSKERLLSPEARAAWIEPDLGPLVLPPVPGAR